MKHSWERGETHRKFWSGNLGVDGRIILEWVLGRQGGKLWNGFNWLRIETSGGIL
jgi:hypothetical protein